MKLEELNHKEKESLDRNSDDIVEPPIKKRLKNEKKSYNYGRRCEHWQQKVKKTMGFDEEVRVEWTIKAPWAIGILKEDGLIHLLRCTISSIVK